MSVTAEQIRTARKADLYTYMLNAHPDAVRKEGYWIRLRTNPSICTKQGLGGFKDYASNETGNSIDFLVRHMNYDFVKAVNCLTRDTMVTKCREPPKRIVTLPERAADFQAVQAYLTGRGFTKTILDRLFSDHLLYQDTRRNAVFCSAEGDFFELRGTHPDKPFHQCGKASSDCFWSFSPDGNPVRALICESAIDAVSLYLLHLRTDGDSADGNLYCGIAGVANQQAIEKIQRKLPTLLAVDNDAAGNQCRLRNSHLPALIPKNKDWNEDLLERAHSVCRPCVYGGDEFEASD